MVRTSARTSEDIEHWYVCGRCGNHQYALVDQELPFPCIDCDWPHYERKPSDIPKKIRLDLNQY